MRKIFSILFLLLLSTIAFGQTAQISIPLVATEVSEPPAPQPMYVGLDETATTCQDPSLGEADAPPFPPPGGFGIVFDLDPYGCPALTQFVDYRNATFPYTGSVQHTLSWQRSTSGTSINIDYEIPDGATMTITDQLGGGFLNIGPFTGTGTAVIPGTYPLNTAYLVMDYTNISPPGPEPVFSIDPASLDFGSVTIGDNATLQATVSNTGDADLVISDITSTDGQFTISPTSATIPAGGSLPFDVTFAPTAEGPQTATLDFTHNAAGSPTSYSVQGIGVTGPTPVFSIDPSSLDFGSVYWGDVATLLATVTNTGTADLVISDLSSSDGQFTFSPAAPITLLPGNDQVFEVSFTPTGSGTQTATLDFTHNAAGSPTSYSVQGDGVNPAPVFSISANSLNFGNVDVGTSEDLTVTVSNTGVLDPLIITSAEIAAAEFTVSPTSATILAGESQTFTVTFTPPADNPYTGTLVFTDNADGPHNVALTGNGYVPPAVFGLIFQEDTVYQLEDASYPATMQLIGLDPAGEKVQAIQFRLAVNKASDDNTILTFQNIEKGGDLADDSWILDYNVFRGPITGNGASVDSIYVLVYNLNEQGGLDPSIDYNDLFTVHYRIANLPALEDTMKSSFLISHAEASTYDGWPIDITPSRDELTVMAINRVSSIGDVNGDGCLDILDLIMVVDHIVGRDSLTGDYFTRADIAPWSPGAEEPEPDGFVNVQDLSLIQNIILTGEYPNGTEINSCSYGAPLAKISGDYDAKVTFYISKEGISIYLDSKFDIRGAQVEFGNVINNPQNLVINTDLGQGHYQKVNNLLRTVMYDRLGNKYIEAGEHFMADMPFNINNPEELNLENLILVNTDKQKLDKIEVEIIYGGAPSLPLDYILFQNYPNPFNPSTTVKFQVPDVSDVTVKIYNMLGQEIRTLFSSQVQRGNYSVQWDGKDNSGVMMSSGTYIYRMTAGSFVQSKKMIFLK